MCILIGLKSIVFVNMCSPDGKINFLLIQTNKKKWQMNPNKQNKKETS